MTMISILTVFKSGGEFTQDYVQVLKEGLERYLTIPYRFVCLTDTVKLTEYRDGIIWEPLKHNWPGVWSKVEMFRPDMEEYGKILYIDLTVIIVGNMDDIASYPTECVTEDFYHGGPSQSILMYRPSTYRNTWDMFMTNPKGWMDEGNKMIPPNFRDQILMVGLTIPYWQEQLPGQVVSFKVHCQNGIPPNARIIKFHGHPRPHEIDIYEMFDQISTVPQRLIDNMDELVTAAKARNWPEIDVIPKHNKEVSIIAYGPNLADEFYQHKHQTLVCVNQAHDWLIDQGIIPQVCIFLDSDPCMVDVIKEPHPDVMYLCASITHPDLLDKLEGFNVYMWHTSKIMGGNNVGQRAITVMHTLGYRNIHCFGLCGCILDGERYAAEDRTKDTEEAYDTTIQDINFGGKSFKGTAENACHGESFWQVLNMHEDTAITLHGRGLLPYMAEVYWNKRLQEQEQ